MNGDVESIRHTVINTVLHDIGQQCPGELLEALTWLAPRVEQMGGTSITWVAARNLARFEALQRFSRLGPAKNSWVTAVRLRAFAALLDRVSDRLLIDIGWIRSNLGRGISPQVLKADLIARHKSLLFNEIHTVWDMLVRYYNQGESTDPTHSPTRREFESGTPRALREHDRVNRPAPLQDQTGEGFPLPEGSDLVHQAARFRKPPSRSKPPRRRR